MHPQHQQRVHELTNLLHSLALDLRESFDTDDGVWSHLEAATWDDTHSPWMALRRAPTGRLAHLAEDAQYVDHVRARVEARDRRHGRSWFDAMAYLVDSVAVFSMRHQVSPALPMPGGRLGTTVGDQVKASSDLGLPVTAVGLVFDRTLAATADAAAASPADSSLPLRPARMFDGTAATVRVPLDRGAVTLRAWHAVVGRSTLLLLDADHPDNTPTVRTITASPATDDEQHLRQQLVLGVGGWRMLGRLGVRPEVCHLHGADAALAFVERASRAGRDRGWDLTLARTVTRSGNLVTLHGGTDDMEDGVSASSAWRVFSSYAEEELGLDENSFLRLGHHPHDRGGRFSMLHLALRFAGATNATSCSDRAALGAALTGVFRRWPPEEIPLGLVSGGVHIATWQHESVRRLADVRRVERPARGHVTTVVVDERSLSDHDLWALRNDLRARLTTRLRNRGDRLDPHVLTIGITSGRGRRMRGDLPLFDTERLEALITDREQAIQVVVTGDPEEGGAWNAWRRFADREAVDRRIALVDRRDLASVARVLQGVDVWLDVDHDDAPPGTSAMKAMTNGAITVASLAGWWRDTYQPHIGWAPSGASRAARADALYRVLSEEIVPSFYRRPGGLPVAWLRRVRSSMNATPGVSATRSVRDFAESYYIPLAATLRARSADGAALGIALHRRVERVADTLHRLAIGSIDIAQAPPLPTFRIMVRADLAGLEPKEIALEAYAEGDPPLRRPFTVVNADDNANVAFHVSVPRDRPVEHYSLRASTAAAGLAIPLEAPAVRWFSIPDGHAH
jgi:starch phosphorylase